MSKRSRLEAELIRTKIAYKAQLDIVASQKPVIEQQEARIASLVSVAKQYKKDLEEQRLIYNERDHLLDPEWQAETRDELARLFDFKTRYDLRLNTSVMCQFPDITLVIISHLFRPMPLMYDAMYSKFSITEASSHQLALESIAALLSTCRYMHYEIGRRYYANFYNRLIDNARCNECGATSLRKCNHCKNIYCWLCVWTSEQCDVCLSNSCANCMHVTPYTVCCVCGEATCRQCDANANDYGCDWCHCDIDLTSNEAEDDEDEDEADETPSLDDTDTSEG